MIVGFQLELVLLTATPKLPSLRGLLLAENKHKEHMHFQINRIVVGRTIIWGLAIRDLVRVLINSYEGAFVLVYAFLDSRRSWCLLHLCSSSATPQYIGLSDRLWRTSRCFWTAEHTLETPSSHVVSFETWTLDA